MKSIEQIRIGLSKDQDHLEELDNQHKQETSFIKGWIKALQWVLEGGSKGIIP